MALDHVVPDGRTSMTPVPTVGLGQGRREDLGPDADRDPLARASESTVSATRSAARPRVIAPLVPRRVLVAP